MSEEIRYTRMRNGIENWQIRKMKNKKKKKKGKESQRSMQ